MLIVLAEIMPCQTDNTEDYATEESYELRNTTGRRIHHTSDHPL